MKDDPAEEPDGRIVEVPGLAFLVPSLEPGAYRVELCADPACEETDVVGDAVNVRRGEIAVLELH